MERWAPVNHLAIMLQRAVSVAANQSHLLMLELIDELANKNLISSYGANVHSSFSYCYSAQINKAKLTCYLREGRRAKKIKDFSTEILRKSKILTIVVNRKNGVTGKRSAECNKEIYNVNVRTRIVPQKADNSNINYTRNSLTDWFEPWMLLHQYKAWQIRKLKQENCKEYKEWL